MIIQKIEKCTVNIKNLKTDDIPKVIVGPKWFNGVLTAAYPATNDQSCRYLSP